MIWVLEWGPVVYRDVKRLLMRTAAELCAAVIRFAATGRGPVDRMYPHDPRRLQLAVPGAIAYLYADEETGVLLVSRMFRRG